MATMLQPEVAEVFRKVFTDALKRYGMAHAELIEDHQCRKMPSAKEQAELKEYRIIYAPCICKSLKLSRVDKNRRSQIQTIIHNVLKKHRAISQELALVLIRLMLGSPKARAWRQNHPGENDPLWQFYFSDQGRFLRIRRPVDWNPPKAFPKIGFTPRGVEELATVLTRKLADKHCLKKAHPDVRNYMIQTMREMHDECNAAFIGRLKFASRYVRIDVTTEKVPVKYESVRRSGIEERDETTTAIVHDLQIERPEGARDPDTFQHLGASLFNEWCLDEERRAQGTEQKSSEAYEAPTE